MPTNRQGAAGSKASARRARAEQLRQAERARSQRRRRIGATGSVLAVVAVIAALVLSYVIVGHGKPRSGAARSDAPSSVIAAATGVPVSTLQTVGAGTAEGKPSPLTGQDLPASSKPQILYIGAEWCPYCAGERWPMVVALSRFGSFSNLGVTESSPTDVHPRTPTFSFHGATYSSPYLELVAKEVYSNQVVNGQYALLDPLTATEKSLFGKGGGGFPYLNIGGKYRVGIQYNVGVLDGKTMAEIAGALDDPATAVAKAIDGSANVLTATICSITNDQPSSVCTDPTIVALKSKLGATS